MTVLADAYSALRHHRHAKRYPDVIALAIVMLIAAMAAVTLFNGRAIVLGQETIVHDIPMWTYLGQRLHSLGLPAWNPYQLGGVPFAADPGSGWMYLPVVVLFTVLSIAKATAILLVAHFIIAGIGIFLFARVIGLDLPGATATGIAFVSSNWFYTASIGDPTQVAVVSWLPWALLFAELAIRPGTLFRRITLTGLAAATFSQILGVWYGDGALYALVVLTAWLIYRTLVETWGDDAGMREHVVDLAMATGGIGIWTLLLGAAGLFPRVAVEKTSGFGLSLVDPSNWHLPNMLVGGAAASPGDVIIYLAILAAFIAGRRLASPFFIGAIVVALLIETNHFMIVASMPIAMLAGIGVTLVLSKAVSDRLAMTAIVAIVVVFLGIAIGAHGMTNTDRIVEFAVVAALTALTALMLSRDKSSWRYLLVAVALLLHMAMFLDRGDNLKYVQSGPVVEVNPGLWYLDSPAVRYIKKQLATTHETVRFFGYDPDATGAQDQDRNKITDPMTFILELNNRATPMRLYDIQGSGSPVQSNLSRELLTNLNGGTPANGNAMVLSSGLDSPFLDLLNVKYIIIPATFDTSREDLVDLTKRYPAVYRDDNTLILDRGSNFGPAFLVNKVEPVTSSQQAFDLVDQSGKKPGGATTPPAIANLRLTAPVDGEALDEPASPRSLGTATVTTYDPEKIEVQTRAIGDRQLVLSEMVYPGWKATIDGKDVPIETAYGAFRSVRVPAGTHTVTFAYTSTPLLVGVMLSVLAYLALAACTLWLITTPALRRDVFGAIREALRWPRKAGSAPMSLAGDASSS